MEQKDILSTIRHSDGRTVPEGYFQDFTDRLNASLPVQAWETQEGAKPVQKPRSFWQKVRPYVYLAAMFAGIWCMLNIFNVTSGSSPEQMMSQNPVLAQALSDKNFVEDLDLSEEDLDLVIDNLYQEGVSVNDIRNHFNDPLL